MRTLIGRGGTPVSAASTAMFRIGFGLAGVLLVTRFFANGWIRSLYLEPRFHFTYPGFDWVRPLPGGGMYLIFGLIGLSALAVAVGFRHRLFAVVFAAGLGYVELIDRSLYLNHYYWLVLTGMLIACLPMSNGYSFDATRGRVDHPGWVPMRVVWMLRFQVGMVYVFAGIAKLNSDWLVRGEPLATWLPARSEVWLIGPILTLPAIAFLLSWAGALFDLTIVGWLSWRRTRLGAYLVVLVFHTLTWILFPSIGLFPLIMSMGALVFFEPDWPEPLLATSFPARRQPGSGLASSPFRVVLAGIYILAMVAIPLRHHLTGGDNTRQGEGYLASWEVMLNERSGSVEFIVADPGSGESWRVGPPDYLTERQASVMATDPALIAQTARAISADYGGLPVSADARVSINGRRSEQLTDPAVILSGDTTDPSSWVVAGG